MSSTPTSMASPKPVGQSVSILSDSEGEYIMVKCGSVDGKLYLNLIRDCTGWNNYLTNSANTVIIIIIITR